MSNIMKENNVPSQPHEDFRDMECHGNSTHDRKKIHQTLGRLTYCQLQYMQAKE